MTEVKTYPVRMYLYSKISTITKTAQWIFSTKPQQEISIGGKIMKGFSSSHFIPGQQTVASKAIDTVFNEQTTDPVVMRHVLFHSVCEHHLLPFFGSVNLAYVPNGKVAGLRKLARAVEVAAKRPQVQERLTMQVADAIYSALEPHVVAVEIDAEHLCMAMRGIKKPGTKVITTAVRGSFEGLDLDKRDLLASLRGMI